MDGVCFGSPEPTEKAAQQCSSVLPAEAQGGGTGQPLEAHGPAGLADTVVNTKRAVSQTRWKADWAFEAVFN